MQSCLWRLRLLGGDIDGGKDGAGLRNSRTLARESGLLLDVAHCDRTGLLGEELLQVERSWPYEIP